MYATDRKVADANVSDLQLQGRLEEAFWDHVTGACVTCEALHGTGRAASSLVTASCMPPGHAWYRRGLSMHPPRPPVAYMRRYT